ncbi:MAG: DUF4213 domain-containing protein [Mucilaginibacter sp.]
MKLPEIKLPEGAGTTAVKIGGAAVGVYFLKKWYENWAGQKAKEYADGKLDSDPDAAIARGLMAALNPSGYNWLRWVDGAHPDTIYELAEKITDYKKVQDFYKGLTENNRNLDDDLTTKLGDQGFQKFLAIATKGKTGLKKYAKTRDDIPTNYWVVTTKDANVRTTAENKSRLNPWNNIVKKVAKGKIVGISTGKFIYDEPNDVTYIEFYTMGTKKPGKVFFYVAKSQVEYLTNAQKQAREKSGKIPLEILAGLEGEADTPQTQLVSRRACTIYDENFKPVLNAPKNIILGFPLMNLRTENNEYVKFKTIQGNVRWVAVADARVENRI